MVFRNSLSVPSSLKNAYAANDATIGEHPRGDDERTDDGPDDLVGAPHEEGQPETEHVLADDGGGEQEDDGEDDGLREVRVLEELDVVLQPDELLVGGTDAG